ncbi:MAG: 2-C-methyl-D-erythritol 4-phosphate cytidylyltransferase [Bacteroidales bacterium]|nr:2-C-methyl-D-erythritol 4-phosphate cytidylyltransferase [Bacteroidales bacterium]
MKKYAIIVAGGIGKRMLSETPKQFLQVAGKPILMHTIEQFSDFSDEIQIILVLPSPFINFWNSLCKRFGFTIHHEVVEGGKTRFLSVKNGLQNIKQNGIVGIHDGVRPLVNKSTIQNAFKSAEEKGNGIPAIKINESVRKFQNNANFPVKRSEYRLIQTPQCFQSNIILRAYQQEYQEHFTDDATVVENLGISINLVDGNPENIKVTSPADLIIAEALLT